MPIPNSVKQQIEKRDQAVTHIDLSNCGLNDNDVSELQELLQNNTYINSINLAYNNITEISCQLLCLLPQLKKVDLSHCHVGDKGLLHLVKTKIEYLNVSSCGITKEGADLLLSRIDQFKELEIIQNPSIPENLAYQIRKKFIPGLAEASFLPPGMIDLGLNIHSSFLSSGDNEVITPILDKDLNL